MVEVKSKLLREFEISLLDICTPEQINNIGTRLRVLLADYDVTSASYELIPYDTTNQDLLKQFGACMIISGKSKGTIKQYIHEIERLIEYRGKRLLDMTTEDIQAYLGHRLMNGVAKSSVNNYRNYISSFYRWAEKTGLMEKNICAPIEQIKYPKEIKPSFKDIDIDRMRNSITCERDRAIFEIFLSSGLRIAELVNLDISDIDFTTLRIHVRNGKGGKDRYCYMSRVAMYHLNLYLQERKTKSEPLFLTSDKEGSRYNHRITDDCIRRVLYKISKELGIKKCNPHKFRHTFATILYNKGMDVHEIQRLMGHEDISTTLKYISTDDHQIANNHEKFMN